VSLFEEMKTHKAGPASVKPCVVSCNTLLNAYAYSKDPGAAERAERFLDRMILGGIPEVIPNVVSFNTAIKACVEVGDLSKADNLLQWMKSAGIKPDDITHRILDDKQLIGSEKFASETNMREVFKNASRSRLLLRRT
jgi:pentatricopeptide repeat protein